MIDQGHLKNGEQRCRERRRHKAHTAVRAGGLKGDTTESWQYLRRRCEDLKLLGCLIRPSLSEAREAQILSFQQSRSAKPNRSWRGGQRFPCQESTSIILPCPPSPLTVSSVREGRFLFPAPPPQEKPSTTYHKRTHNQDLITNALPQRQIPSAVSIYESTTRTPPRIRRLSE